MNTIIRKYFIAIILLGFSSMIGYFYYSNTLVFYIYPRYISLTIGAAIVLLILGGCMMFSSVDALRQRGFFSHTSAWSAILLLIPLFLGFGISPQPLSMQTASLRGVNTDMSMVYASSDDFSFVFAPEKRSFRDWIGLLALDPEPSHHAGQPVHISGAILHDQTLPENMLYLVRFQIACCAADARPIALPIVFDPKRFSSDQFPENQWIHIAGMWEEGEIAGARKAIIRLESFEEISIPNDPYLY